VKWRIRKKKRKQRMEWLQETIKDFSKTGKRNTGNREKFIQKQW